MFFQLFSNIRGALGKLILMALVSAATLIIIERAAFAQAPGGFLEKSFSANARPMPSAAEIQSFLPATRGIFTFPAPYNSEGIRLTNAGDCAGADCVNYIGYSYWRNINNHVGSDTMLIFLGLDRGRGGQGPTLFSFNKTTNEVKNLGPLFDAASPFSWHSAESWYFSASQPTKLYVHNNGPQLYRYDVISKSLETVLDISSQFGSDKYVYQVHSSNDDKAHSFTLRQSGTWAVLGCAAYREDSGQYFFYPVMGDFDECQIDKSGRWLVIKENVDGLNGEDNRIIDLQTGTERVLLDQDGAGGHSDAGYGYMVAADNWNNLPFATRLWKFDQNPLQAPVVYHQPDWNTYAPQHVSHTNARAGLLPEEQYVCGGSANQPNGPRGNEVICFRLDGSLDVLVVAPVMTDVNAAGGGDSYAKMPKGNLDITGGYFIWTSNMGGSRLDVFIVKVPAQLLIGASPPADTTAPVISAVSAPFISSSTATVSWTTNEASDSQVEYGPTAAYGNSTPINSSMVSSHSQGLSGLNSNSLYHYRVKSKDAAGNLAVSTDSTFTTPAVADITLPTLSVTAPTSGSTVSGTITVSAGASDNVGVVGVQFKLDGVNLGAEDTTAPYAISWNSTTATNGSHTLTAVARDAAGNSATSTAITVTVSNTASVNSSIIFTDDPFAQDTPIKAVHITELRQAINTLRSTNGLLAFSFTDSTLGTGSTQIRAMHVMELRSALDPVYDAQKKVRPTYTDPTITAGQTVIKKAHIAEIRQAVKAVE